jgi:uncharacterized protein (TIGR00156 family)
MKRPIHCACAIVLLSCSLSAMAQAPGYSGPSTPTFEARGQATVPVLTVKQLLATGVDDQVVILKGRLIRHTGGKHYDFADPSGEMRVEIKPEHFPLNVKIDAHTEVEVIGEFDKERFGRSELEVQQIRVAVK